MQKTILSFIFFCLSTLTWAQATNRITDNTNIVLKDFKTTITGMLEGSPSPRVIRLASDLLDSTESRYEVLPDGSWNYYLGVISPRGFEIKFKLYFFNFKQAILWTGKRGVKEFLIDPKYYLKLSEEKRKNSIRLALLNYLELSDKVILSFWERESQSVLDELKNNTKIRIEVVDYDLVLNGKIKTALNSQDGKFILINRFAWDWLISSTNTNISQFLALALIRHEVYGVLGIERNSYAVSREVLLGDFMKSVEDENFIKNQSRKFSEELDLNSFQRISVGSFLVFNGTKIYQELKNEFNGILKNGMSYSCRIQKNKVSISGVQNKVRTERPISFLIQNEPVISEIQNGNVTVSLLGVSYELGERILVECSLKGASLYSSASLFLDALSSESWIQYITPQYSRHWLN